MIKHFIISLVIAHSNASFRFVVFCCAIRPFIHIYMKQRFNSTYQFKIKLNKILYNYYNINMFELKVVFDTLEELQDFLNGHSEKEAIIDKIKKTRRQKGTGDKGIPRKGKTI